MLLLILVVFLAVFALAALLLSTGRSNTSKELQTNLDAALKRSRVSADDERLPDIRKNTLLSSIPWLNNLLAERNTALELRRLLDQADLNWTPSRLLMTAAAAWVISAYLIDLKAGLGAVSLLFGLLPGMLPFYYVYWKRGRRLNLILKRLPDTLDLMVSALRAGNSMMGSLGHAARESPEPLGRELRLCFEEQNYGVDMRQAVQNLIDRVPLQEIRIMTTAMLINKESGGNLAEVLDKTAAVIRDRFRLKQQIRVHTAQGRLTGLILSLMPVILGAVLFTLNPPYIRLLFTHPTGIRMAEVAGCMNLIGLLIIRKIVNIRV
jgi:tight adherence protein B